MRCQFCSGVLEPHQSVACSREPCRKAAKKVRRRRRRASALPIADTVADGRSGEFPPELEYLNQDPGITIEQLWMFKRPPQALLTKRAMRRRRLLERLAEVR